MIGRAYIGEVLIQTSECIKREFEKILGFMKAPQAHGKIVRLKYKKETKQLRCKNFCGDRKAFIRLY